MTLQQKLINHFIKDAEHTENPLVRERYGRFASLAGIGSNFLLFVIKITTGLLFHSLAITADAFNNLSDSSSSLITLAGFRMSGKPADEEHPFGHERMEYIAGLIVSFLILALGIQLLRSAYDKIVPPRPSEFNWIVLGGLLVSIAIKLWQHLFYRSIGKTIHSMTSWRRQPTAATMFWRLQPFWVSAPDLPGDRCRTGRLHGCGCRSFHPGHRCPPDSRYHKPAAGAAGGP
jgi:hypothetical protein